MFHAREIGRGLRRARLVVELLEDRTVPSGAAFQPQLLIVPAPGGATTGSSSPPPAAFSPAGIDQAYGINTAIVGDGTGQTIAIIDAYDNPKLVSRSSTLPLAQDTSFLASDLHQFDLKYNLPEPPGFFTKVNQFGGTNYPGTDPTEPPGTVNWEAEEALDVEWAHSIAPGAHILLVEAFDDQDNLYSAAGWAGNQSGVSVVSMSFSGTEDSTETTVDPFFFTSPAGHGVTYFAATGDNGATGSGHQNDGYPAYSPNVVAVGGTVLQVSDGNYSSESGWSGSGGGVSLYESKPAYQSAVMQSSTNRTAPDIAFDASPGSGVAVYDTYNGGNTPWYQFGGTSVATPCWAALVSIADQMRAGQGLPSLDGPSQTLPTLYNLASGDFHDITTGNNGYPAGNGYDLVTGLGSPVPSKLLPDLAGLWVSSSTPAAGSTLATPPTTFSLTFSDPVVPNSLSPGALQVNGIAAGSVSLDATDTIATFTYASSPVTAAGSQTLSLAAGSAKQLDNPATSSLAYSAKFNFAPLTLAVTSTNPAVGGTIAVPQSSITFDVNFNEAFDPAGVGVGNLTLSQGTVTAATPLAGNQTIAYTISGLTAAGMLTVTLPAGTLKDQYDFTSAGAFSGSYNLVGPHLVISAPASVTAGSGFLFTVQAEDAFDNPTSNFSGMVSFATTDPQGSVPAPAMVNGGFGYFVSSLKTAAGSPWTITATSGSLNASSQPIAVTPSLPVKLSFGSQPINTPTGTLIAPVTVNILDAYGNVVTSDNSDQVTLGLGTGPGGFMAGSTTTVTAVAGVATFANLTLVVPGTYKLSEFVTGSYTGPNSSSFVVAPLQVVPGSFAGAPWGFSLKFNTAYLVNSVTPVLYGLGTSIVPSVTVTETTDAGGNPVNISVVGSLVLDPAANAITFVATNTGLELANNSPLLPDGTYTVVVRATAAGDGFQALSGGGFLDGLGTGTPGSGDYTATFTVHAAGADVLWIPATADGPGEPLSAPGMNQAGGGYPIYLNDSTGSVTSVQVTLNYNPALLNVTGVSGPDFTLLGTSTPGQAILQYNSPALPAGNETPIGFVTATVPGGTAGNPMPYRAKDLLHLLAASLNGGRVTVATGDALHLVAYVGDADGNGAYTSNDAVLITRVAIQADAGFAAYPLVDPVIVADTDGSSFIPADAALQVNEAGVGFPTNNLPTPPIPGGVYFQPMANNVDPTLSLEVRGQGTGVSSNGTLTVSVNLDDAHPQGSTGLIEAHLALVYDPRQFTVSAADVHLGSVPEAGSGWSVTASVNPIMGQIAIALSSTVPIAQPIGGSLVTIDLHSVGNVANTDVPPIFLVASVNPTDQQMIPTELEDAQGTFTLGQVSIHDDPPWRAFNVG